ncbi:PREDICTED: uncharacterized protein C4orf45 homolog [Nanorana parkeri]|uniref:uncharacterized protein C4orf45 homolog n=1 Tax=Nanorana parkeri TaxID=125878 RepID=UPI000854D142|nr:PREDICTED: uncharacterized protein C4orf45 homolog [Nanorana parkeri]
MHQEQHGRPSTSFSCRPHYESGKRMLYTGPDYARDYRPKRPDCPRYIGEHMPSVESTSEVDYLWRAAPGAPAPLPKECYVGGIGWGVPEFTFHNINQLGSSYQIKVGVFRRACEDRVTHKYQNPWHPPPHILDTEGPGSRATLAWTQERYDDYMNRPLSSLHERSKTPTLNPDYFHQKQWCVRHAQHTLHPDDQGKSLTDALELDKKYGKAMSWLRPARKRVFFLAALEVSHKHSDEFSQVRCQLTYSQ